VGDSGCGLEGATANLASSIRLALLDIIQPMRMPGGIKSNCGHVLSLIWDLDSTLHLARSTPPARSHCQRSPQQKPINLNESKIEYLSDDQKVSYINYE
jgi:hypothetical protein